MASSSKQLEYMQEFLIGIADGNFDAKLKIANERNTDLVALQVGINMIIEELKHTTISRLFLNSIYDAINDILIVINEKGEIQKTNHQSETLLKFSETELLHQSIESVFQLEDLELVNNLIKNAFENGTIQNVGLNLIAKDHSAIPVSCSFSPLYNKHSHPFGVLLVGKNITTLLEAKNSLQTLFFGSKKDILLVEGKHDKTHIETALNRLSNEFHDLDFDVFDMNGATNIKQMMIGLANCGQVFKHKIIAIYDNDKEGQSEIKQNFNKESEPILRLVDKKGNPSSTFYAILLPKPTGFIDDFTIENLYSSDKHEQAYKDALCATTGYFSNKSIETIAEDMKIKSKNILAENSKGFDKKDFINFRPLFELLKEIKAL